MYSKNKPLKVPLQKNSMLHKATTVMSLLMAAFVMSACTKGYVRYDSGDPKTEISSKEVDEKIRAFQKNAEPMEGYYTIIGRYLNADSENVPKDLRKIPKDPHRLADLCGKVQNQSGLIAVMENSLSGRDTLTMEEIRKKGQPLSEFYIHDSGSDQDAACFYGNQERVLVPPRLWDKKPTPVTIAIATKHEVKSPEFGKVIDVFAKAATTAGNIIPSAGSVLSASAKAVSTIKDWAKDAEGIDAKGILRVRADTVKFDINKDNDQYPSKFIPVIYEEKFIPVLYEEKKFERVVKGPITVGYVELRVEVIPSKIQVNELTEEGYPDFSKLGMKAEAILRGEEFKLTVNNRETTLEDWLNKMAGGQPTPGQFLDRCVTQVRPYLDNREFSQVDKAFILNRLAEKHGSFAPSEANLKDWTSIEKSLDYHNTFCFKSGEDELKEQYEAALERSHAPLLEWKKQLLEKLERERRHNIEYVISKLRIALKGKLKWRSDTHLAKFLAKDGIDIEMTTDGPANSSLPKRQTHLSLKQIKENWDHWRLQHMGCYVDLAGWDKDRDSKKGTVIGRSGDFAVIYADKDTNAGRGGLMMFHGKLADHPAPNIPVGLRPVSHLWFDEITSEDINHMDRWFADEKESKCIKSRLFDKARAALASR
uniref:Uncharacterized protein n=1 Tax=Candidatus Kentrum sp. TC TaxID=2126339 RepID=A0A450YH52_9GAMM|nr:MAG: hypothetical protein BECKTC1821E_GA0114239_100815 [Candidatus Kentron sp. TC]